VEVDEEVKQSGNALTVCLVGSNIKVSPC